MIRFATSFTALVVALVVSETAVLAQPRVKLVGHDDHKQIRDLAFSPDGSLLATASDDRTARIWDATTGDSVIRLDHAGRVERAVFSPDGKLLATAHVDDETASGGVRFWNVQTWEEIGAVSSGRVQSLGFSPDSKRLVTAAFRRDGPSRATTVNLWDATTGNVLKILRETDVVSDVAFSPDGTRLAAVGLHGGKPGRGALFIWRTDALDNVTELNNAGSNMNLQFSPSNALLAVSVRHTVRGNPNKPPCRVDLWTLDDIKRIGTLQGFVGWIASMAFSPDSRTLAATATVPGGWGVESGEVIKVWNLVTGNSRVVERNSHSRSLQFSPHGDVLAASFTTPHPGIRLWDTRSNRVLATLKQGKPQDVVMSIRYSPQGDKLAVANLSRSRFDPLCIWFVAATDSTSDRLPQRPR